jgi:hypothetical protein
MIRNECQSPKYLEDAIRRRLRDLWTKGSEEWGPVLYHLGLLIFAEIAHSPNLFTFVKFVLLLRFNIREKQKS